MARSKAAQRLRPTLKAALHSTFAHHLWTASGLIVLLGSGLIGMLVVSPELTSPRRGALQTLVAASTALQASQGDPSREPPQIWHERLGIRIATQLWTRLGHGLWWQAWSDDGEPHLIIPWTVLERSSRESLEITQINDLAVVSANALTRRQLLTRIDQLSPEPPQPNAVEVACLRALSRSPSLQWSPQAIGRYAGEAAPLLAEAGYGCLSHSSDAETLRWYGWVSRDPLETAAVVHPASARVMDTPSETTMTAPLLLEGEQFRALVAALTAREVVRNPLASRYGINAGDLDRLIAMPFRLRLVANPSQAFQAGVQIQLWTGGDSDAVRRSLSTLADQLRMSGWTTTPSDPIADGWLINEGGSDTPVGGWRWLQTEDQDPVLSLGLGLAPANDVIPTMKGAARTPWFGLQASPETLDALGMLPAQTPLQIRRASSLRLTLTPLVSPVTRSGAVHQFSGQLSLPTGAET